MSENQNNNIRISAVMPAYNAEKHIRRAIESIIKQSRPADEIIIVDDGSTDGTADIIRKYGDKIKYVYQENAGEAVARNRAIEEAACEWVAFLDADDEWLPENLEILEGVVTGNKNLVWAFGNFINCSCETEKRSIAHKNEIPEYLLGGKEFFSNYLAAFKEGFNACTISNIFKKEIFDTIGKFTPGQQRGADTDMWLRIAYKYPQVGYVREPLAIYHKGITESMTSSHRNFDIISDMIEKHLKLSKENGCREDFVPCASHMLGVWIRDMLSTNDTDGLLETVERYKELLDWRFRKEMRLRVKHPRIAPYCLALTSSIKRIIHSIKG